MATTTETTTWTLPDLGTLYHLEDHEPMTLGQMLDGVDEDLIPSNQTMLEDLLWAFGAWESLEETNAAMQPDGKVGFTLVNVGQVARRRHNRIRASWGRPAGRPQPCGGRGIRRGPGGPGCGCRCFCRRRCAQATQAHYPQAVAPWDRGAVGRGSGRPRELRQNKYNSVRLALCDDMQLRKTYVLLIL